MRLARPLFLLALAALALAAPARAQTIWAVGDAQSEDVSVQNAVASRIQAEGAERLLFLGDFSNGGSAEEYQTLYGPSYGRFKSITMPTPGNHDTARRTTGYDAYWGPSFRQPDGGHYYSFDIGGWHFVSLDSEEPISAGSPQLNWLRSDLQRRRGTCTIVFDHRPRYSAGPQYNTISLEPAWAALGKHAVALLSGHAHNYQRHFPTRGITQFVVGTGGGELGNTDNFDPRLAARSDISYGALRLRLGLGEASYEFISTSNGPLDAGTLECTTAQPAPARVTVSRPRGRATYRAFRSFRGRLLNTRRIQLSILRRVGRSTCSVFDGTAFVRASCSSRKAFPVLTPRRDRFAFKFPRSAGLPAGAYRLTVAARAIDGTLTRKVTRFKVAEKRTRKPRR